MNTKKRMEAKNEFEKNLFKLIINSIFGKTMENLKKDRDIKLVKTDEQRSKLISEPNYHTTDTDSFIIHITAEDFFEDIADDVTKWFDTSNYDENDKRPPLIGMNKKVYGFSKMN